MNKTDYDELLKRETILRDLKFRAEVWSENYPAIAIVALGAIIAVKMNRTPELAQLIKEFAKSLVDFSSTTKIEEERQKITNLLLLSGEPHEIT